MDRTVARLNIEHFHALLENETDAPMRSTLFRLLAEEEAKLAKFNAQPEQKNLWARSTPASVSDARQSTSRSSRSSIHRQRGGMGTRERVPLRRRLPRVLAHDQTGRSLSGANSGANPFKKQT